MQWFLSLVFVFMLQNCEQWSPPLDSWQDKSGEIILERRLSLINHQLIFASTVTVHENFFWSVLSSAKSSFCGRRKGNSWFPRMRSKRNYSFENHNYNLNLHLSDAGLICCSNSVLRNDFQLSKNDVKFIYVISFFISNLSLDLWLTFIIHLLIL